MSERPILFSGPMVRAILAGRKTMTRRVVKPQPEMRGGSWFLEHKTGSALMCDSGLPSHMACGYCPYGKPGDLLWVRETWAAAVHGSYEAIKGPLKGYYNVKSPWSFSVQYAADRATFSYRLDEDYKGAWRPSIHMPRWASRITLRITDVRVERLHDITEEDALAEGVWTTSVTLLTFIALWEDINGPGSWEANPYVWVVSFERVTA